MVTRILHRWLPLFALFGFVSWASGQTTPVAVRDVRFDYVRPSSGGDQWLQATVELDVSAKTTDAAGNPQFTDRVRVGLSLGFETRYAVPDGFRFFHAEAEAVTLEAGRAYFRFYLPPEVIQRDEISGAPYAYLVELFVGGKPLPLTAACLSSRLNSPTVLRSFQDHVTQSIAANDGVLVPQYLSPFLLDYPRETPSFIRKLR